MSNSTKTGSNNARNTNAKGKTLTLRIEGEKYRFKDFSETRCREFFQVSNKMFSCKETLSYNDSLTPKENLRNICIRKNKGDTERCWKGFIDEKAWRFLGSSLEEYAGHVIEVHKSLGHNYGIFFYEKQCYEFKLSAGGFVFCKADEQKWNDLLNSMRNQKW